MQPPDWGSVFRKTEKGHEELRTRGFGLSPRARQLLILIDGRRPLMALAQLLPPAEFGATLRLLEGEGFVARDAVEPPGGPPGGPSAQDGGG